MTSDPGSRRVLVAVLIAVVATLAFSWATWALFLAPRKGGDSLEAFAESMAQKLRDGDFDGVRDHLDSQFNFEPGSLDRDTTLAVARRESAAGRFFPYVAFVHPVIGQGDDVELAVALGILAQGDPEKSRDVNVLPVRLEMKLRKTKDGFQVLSARAHLGR